MAFVNPFRNELLYEMNTWTIHLALYTTAPDVDGAGGVEVGAGLGYARVDVTSGFTVAVAGEMSNTALITFGPATGDWGTVEALGLINVIGGPVPVGDILVRWLPAPRTVTEGGIYQIAIGDLVIAMEDA